MRTREEIGRTGIGLFGQTSRGRFTEPPRPRGRPRRVPLPPPVRAGQERPIAERPRAIYGGSSSSHDVPEAPDEVEPGHAEVVYLGIDPAPADGFDRERAPLSPLLHSSVITFMLNSNKVDKTDPLGNVVEDVESVAERVFGDPANLLQFVFLDARGWHEGIPPPRTVWNPFRPEPWYYDPRVTALNVLGDEPVAFTDLQNPYENIPIPPAMWMNEHIFPRTYTRWGVNYARRVNIGPREHSRGRRAHVHGVMTILHYTWLRLDKDKFSRVVNEVSGGSWFATARMCADNAFGAMIYAAKGELPGETLRDTELYFNNPHRKC